MIVTYRAKPMEIIISAIVGVVGVVVGALITSASQKYKVQAETHKTEAEYNEQIRKTVMSLIEPLQKRVDELEKELADWQDWANRLVVQVKDMGCKPVPFKKNKDVYGNGK